MAACPDCGRQDWHTHSVEVVDTMPEVKRSKLLDDWDEVESALVTKLSEVDSLVERGRMIQRSLAAKGVTVTSHAFDDSVVEPELEEDEPVIPAIDLRPQRSTQVEVQVPEIQTPSRVLRGVTPRRRSAAPTDGRPRIAKVVTNGVEADDNSYDELREDRANEMARAARLTFQRPLEDVGPDSRAAIEVAEIRRSAGEDVSDDSAGLAQLIASQLQDVESTLR